MVHVREDTYVSNVLPLTLQSRQPLHRTLHRVRVVPSRGVRRRVVVGEVSVSAEKKMSLVRVQGG